MQQLPSESVVFTHDPCDYPLRSPCKRCSYIPSFIDPHGFEYHEDSGLFKWECTVCETKQESTYLITISGWTVFSLLSDKKLYKCKKSDYDLATGKRKSVIVKKRNYTPLVEYYHSLSTLYLIREAIGKRIRELEEDFKPNTRVRLCGGEEDESVSAEYTVKSLDTTTGLVELHNSDKKMETFNLVSVTDTSRCLGCGDTYFVDHPTDIPHHFHYNNLVICDRCSCTYCVPCLTTVDDAIGALLVRWDNIEMMEMEIFFAEDRDRIYVCNNCRKEDETRMFQQELLKFKSKDVHSVTDNDVDEFITADDSDSE